MPPELRAFLRALALTALAVAAAVPGYRRARAREEARLRALLSTPGTWTAGLGTSLLRDATWALEGPRYRRLVHTGWSWDPLPVLAALEARRPPVVLLEENVLFLVHPEPLAAFRASLVQEVRRRTGRPGLQEAAWDPGGPPGPHRPAWVRTRDRAANEAEQEARFRPPSPELAARLRAMARAGIRLVVLPMPRDPRMDGPGGPPRARWARTLQPLVDEGILEVWACPEAFPAEDFTDGAHLASSGSRRYSAWLAGRLAAEGAR